MQEEVKHYKVKSLGTTLRPNSVYYVKPNSQTAVLTYITDQTGVPYPLIDLTGAGNIQTVTGTGVTGTLTNPVINISTFKSSQLGNLIELSSTDGKLFVKPITSPDGSISIVNTLSELQIEVSEALQEQIQSALQPGDNVSELTNDAEYITLADLPTPVIPTFQQVTTEGATSTNGVTFTDSAGNTTYIEGGDVVVRGLPANPGDENIAVIAPSQAYFRNQILTTLYQIGLLADINSNNVGLYMAVLYGGLEAQIAIELADDYYIDIDPINGNYPNFKIPFKPTGDYIFATLSDIPSAITIDANPTDGSSNAVSSNGVFDALANKEPNITGGTISQYWRGDKTWQTLPIYTLSGLGGVPTTREITINGNTFDLSANRSWNVGDLLSSGSYANPTWITSLAYSKLTGAPTIPTVGTWGGLNYPTWTTGTPFVKMTAAGTFALDTNTYLTGITSGQVTTALGYTPVTNARTITINGTTFDLTADRTWTISSSGSLPTGGTVGQILTKVDGTDYNATWQENFADWTSVVKHTVKNNGTGLISKGTAVYVTGSNGTNMLVGKASNASEATSSKTMGLMQSDITTTGSTQTGFVIAEGLLSGLDTAGTIAGDPVWLGVNGALIYGLSNKPYAPAHLVFIGIVTKVSAGSGEIFVKVQNGFELKEIHDIDLITTTPVNGHILGFDGTLWVNKTVAGWLGFTPYSAANPSGFTSNTGTVTSVAALTLGTSGTDLTSTVANGTTTPVITLNVPTASATNRGALSSADWTTFNNKQNNLKTFNRTQGIYYFEEFMGNNAGSVSTSYGNVVTLTSGAGASAISVAITPRANQQQGIIRHSTGTVATNFAGYTYGGIGSSAGSLFIGSGTISIETYVNIETLSTATERFNTMFGYAVGSNWNNTGNAIFFSYDEGGVQFFEGGVAATPNWKCYTRGGSTVTRTNTSVTVNAGQWYKLRIDINAAASSVSFYIDGNLVATHTTNIPATTTAMAVVSLINKSVGTTARTMLTDYFMYEEIFTNPR